MSTDDESRDNYGPFLPNIGSHCPVTKQAIPFNDVEAVRTAFKAHDKNLAGFLVEPIQGEAGIVVPDDNYLSEIRKLCDEYNVLMICDEIQTGIARSGKLLCYEWAGIKPDMVLLGKAISGGMYPVSCVLAQDDVMLTVEPGTHGSTYGGNPLGSALAMRALEIIRDENMVERAQTLGEKFREGLKSLNSPMIKTIRGKGLLNAIVVDETKTGGHSAWDLCMLMKEKGLLVGRGLKSAHLKDSEVQEYTDGVQAKPTHSTIIRLAPPLVITEEEIEKALGIIKEAMEELPNLKGEKEDQIVPPTEKHVHVQVEN
jgi:ornithine--oxo-acid transaminase